MRDGAQWNDFEDVCMGPREWDIGWLPGLDLEAFEPQPRSLVGSLELRASNRHPRGWYRR
jgi:hypothetical protein